MRQILAFYLLLTALPAAAQDTLQAVHVNELVSTHIISPEPIQYVDISTDRVAADLPLANILRLKPKGPAAAPGIVTIVGERFLVQYRLVYSQAALADSEWRIDPLQVRSFLNPAVSMSREQMRRFALQALARKPAAGGAKAQSQGLLAQVNHIYTVGEYFFLDFSLLNKTGIPFTIDQVRFRLEDKKVLRATNFQQVPLQPVYQHTQAAGFKRRYRNVYVFKKFTFPEEKVFCIEVSEQQLSGRTILLRIDYRDVLAADPL